MSPAHNSSHAFMIDSFEITFGLSMQGIGKAAHRFEALMPFKQHVIEEITSMFDNADWQQRILDPFAYGLVHDPDSCRIEDGDLQNWIDITLADCGIPLELGEREDINCFFDRRGCWWPARSYRLRRVDRDGLWTAKEATRNFVQQHNRTSRPARPTSNLDSNVSPSTRRELEDIPYRMNVRWMICPKEEPATQSGTGKS